ncbi:hypothetical protein B0J14DRAFT_677613 [Halenospora varia]|nr:hypothetical protein B0J14DRAFT_677613 [Halenospora varia]
MARLHHVHPNKKRLQGMGREKHRKLVGVHFSPLQNVTHLSDIRLRVNKPPSASISHANERGQTESVPINSNVLPDDITKQERRGSHTPSVHNSVKKDTSGEREFLWDFISFSPSYAYLNWSWHNDNSPIEYEWRRKQLRLAPFRGSGNWNRRRQQEYDHRLHGFRDNALCRYLPETDGDGNVVKEGARCPDWWGKDAFASPWFVRSDAVRWFDWEYNNSWLESREDGRVYNVEDSWTMEQCTRICPSHSTFFTDALWYQGWFADTGRPFWPIAKL